MFYLGQLILISFQFVPHPLLSCVYHFCQRSTHSLGFAHELAKISTKASYSSFSYLQVHPLIPSLLVVSFFPSSHHSFHPCSLTSISHAHPHTASMPDPSEPPRPNLLTRRQRREDAILRKANKLYTEDGTEIYILIHHLDDGTYRGFTSRPDGEFPPSPQQLVSLLV